MRRMLYYSLMSCLAPRRFAANNWISESTFVSVEDSKLRGGGFALKQKLWNEAHDVIAEWTGQELTQCSLYGVRIYHEDAMLATHVDRLPLVSSAIINIDQDLDEPWPLEVIGHDGKAYNVTMEPGDMVLYESHSVLHGRPFPLKGRFMANIFVHFEPTGHTVRHNAGMTDEADMTVDQKYRQALANAQAGHEHEHKGLPSYIIPNSPEESHWRAQHPTSTNGEEEDEDEEEETFTTGSTPAHRHAALGRIKDLEQYIKENKDAVNARDANGWTPLIESARGGHLEIVKLLVEHGADINVKSYGSGATALWWAKQTHGDDHPVIEFLESLGALEAGPEL
jgi:prolyl 4-hydroxylase